MFNLCSGQYFLFRKILAHYRKISRNTPHSNLLVSLGVELSSVLALLQSHQIPVSKISGMNWQVDGLKVTAQSKYIHIESSTKCGDILFNCPVSTGKWYYEVTLASDGAIQIGWANKLMDLSLEVF